MKERKYSNLPTHLPKGQLAFNSASNELFVGNGDNKELMKVTDSILKSSNVDYLGNEHRNVRDTQDANIEYILGEVSTVHYEGQHITATDTIERQVRSAILSGRTLVDLKGRITTSKTTVIENTGYSIEAIINNAHIDDTWASVTVNPKYIKPNTNYFVRWKKIEGVFSNGYVATYQKIGNITLDNNLGLPRVSNNNYTSSNFIVFNTGNYTDASSIDIRFHLNGTGVHSGETLSLSITGLQVIEYQEGMENWDIPYFEGMQSVRMPVLTMTGKNLFDGELELGSYDANGQPMSSSATIYRNKNKYIPVTGGKNICSNYKVFIHQYDENKNFIKYSQLSSTLTMQLESNTRFINFRTNNDIDINVQLEYGTVPTSYEHHKSNILSIDGEYRGIGDVCDTVDCMTGEVVERIVEIVLDSSNSESWRTYEAKGEYSVGKFTLPLKVLSNGGAIPSANIKCDKINVGITNQEGTQEQVSIYYHSTNGDYCELRLCVPNSKLTSTDLEGIKTYVQNNPFTIQYQSAESTIKTVDLKGQKVYSYEGTTHYTCSSEDGSLAPTLSIDVPTNTSVVLAKQRALISTLTAENSELKQEILKTNEERESNDLELLSNDFEMDFRIMNIELNLDVPTVLDLRSSRLRSPYDMAKALILGGKYEYEDMKYKLDVYLQYQKITQGEYDELISLMNQQVIV